MPGDAFIPTDELPRTVPQDPEAVKREREIRDLQRRLDEARKRETPTEAGQRIGREVLETFMLPDSGELGEDPEPIRGGLRNDPLTDNRDQIEILRICVRALTNRLERLEKAVELLS